MDQKPDVQNLVNRLAASLNGLTGKHKITSLFTEDNELRLFFGAVMKHTNRQEHLASSCSFQIRGATHSREISPSTATGVISFPEETKTYLIRVMSGYGKPGESKAKKPRTNPHQGLDPPYQAPPQPNPPPEIPFGVPLNVAVVALEGGVDEENPVVINHLPASRNYENRLSDPTQPHHLYTQPHRKTTNSIWNG